MLAFGTETDDGQSTLVIVQPNDAWDRLELGADAAQVVEVHRELASKTRLPDLAFVADLTLLLTETTGRRQPWVSRRVDLDAALDELGDLAASGQVVSQSVGLTPVGFSLACSPCRDLTIHRPSGKQTLHREDHIDDVKAAVLVAWSESVVVDGLRMRGWHAP